MRGDRRWIGIWVALGALLLVAVLQQVRIQRLQQPHAPTLMAPLPTKAVEGSLYEARLQVVDPDGDALAYRVMRAPEGLELRIEGGPPTILWRPTGLQTGAQHVSIEVLDATHRLSLEWEIHVQAINDPPEIRSEPPQGLARARGFHYKVWAVDEDDKVLTYTLFGAPTGMTVSATGQIDWQPGDDVQDETTFTVRVADPQGASAEQTVTVRFGGVARAGVLGDFFNSVAELDETYMAGVSSSRLAIFAKDKVRDLLAQRFTYVRGPRHLVAHQDVVYIQAAKGVEYYDASNRHELKYLGCLEATLAFSARLMIWQDRLYAVQHNDRPVLCWSLADPRKPAPLPDYPMRSIIQLVFGPTHAYSVSLQTLSIYDTRNLDLPRPITTVPLNLKSMVGGVALRGNYLYLAAGRTLVIYDVGDPAFPTVVKTIPDLYWNTYMNLDLNDTRMWLWGTNSLAAYDVKDPLAPQEILRHPNSMVSEFMASTDHVYIVDADGKAQLAGEATPQFPAESADLLTPAGLISDGKYLYIYSRLNSFVYSLADPLKPRRIATFKISQSARPIMALADGYLYSPWQIVDVRKPKAPRIVGRLPGGDALAVHDGILYLAKGDKVLIFDVNTPSAPIPLQELNAGAGQKIGALGAVDGYLYLALANGVLRTCRIEQNHKLTPIGNLGVGRSNKAKPLHLEIQGDRLYLALYSDGLVAVDLSDPAQPTVHGSYDTSGYSEMVIPVAGMEGVVVSAEGNGGLMVTDFREPGVGLQVGQFGPTDMTSAVAVVGDLIYSADRFGGLGILRCSLFPPAPARPPDPGLALEAIAVLAPAAATLMAGAEAAIKVTAEDAEAAAAVEAAGDLEAPVAE